MMACDLQEFDGELIMFTPISFFTHSIISCAEVYIVENSVWLALECITSYNKAKWHPFEPESAK